MRKTILFSLSLLFLSFIAISFSSRAEDELAPGYNECTDRAQGVTDAMSDCLDNAIDYWEKQLNMNYKKIMQACDETDKEFAKICRSEFKKGELAWIKYRDAMASALSIGNGTGAKLQMKSFYARATKSQAQQLAETDLFW